jgi:hypothetical protein
LAAIKSASVWVQFLRLVWNGTDLLINHILIYNSNLGSTIITGNGERSFCAGADIRYVVNLDLMKQKGM